MSQVWIYQDSSNDWRWRFMKQGRIMADGGQGYSRRIDCLTGCATVLGASLRSSNGRQYLSRPSALAGVNQRISITPAITGEGDADDGAAEPGPDRGEVAGDPE